MITIIASIIAIAIAIYYGARYIERKLTVHCDRPGCDGECFWEGWYKVYICEKCGRWVK